MSDTSMIYIIFFLMVFLLVILAISTLFYKKWISKNNEDQLFMSDKAEGIRWSHAVYRMLNDFPFIKHYIKRLRKRYEIIEPGDNKKIEKDTLKTMFFSTALCIILLTITLAMGLSVYSCIATAALIYIIHSFVIFKSVSNKEMVLLKQTINFISEVRHQYYTTGSVTEAIYESLVEAPQPVETHMEYIYNILESDDVEEEMNIYNDHVPNRFLKLFLSICVSIVRFDDRTVNGESLFIMNLSHLKEDIDIEIRKREKLSHGLGGLSIISAIPIFTLKPIQLWAVSNMPEIEHYYTGAYGAICFTLICLSSLIIYNVILNKHTIEHQGFVDHVYLDKLLDIKIISVAIDNIKYRNYGNALKLDEMLHHMGEKITVEQLYVKRILVGILAVIIGFVLSFSIHFNNRNYILNNTDDMESLMITSSNSSIINEIKEIVVELANIYKDDKDIDLSGIEAVIKSQNILSNDSFIKIAAEEVMKKIHKYQNDYFMWYELVLILLAGAAGFQAPIWEINYRRQKLEMNMEDEVVQFQSIIMLLMYIERISSLDILKWMENFAVVFKNSISECIDDFPNGEQEALERLKEKEPYPGFQKIVDNLLDTDRIGIRRAFDEVQADMRSFSEKRRQDNEIYIGNTVAQCGFLAFVPILEVILLYLCGPMVIESMLQFVQYSKEMNSMM